MPKLNSDFAAAFPCRLLSGQLPRRETMAGLLNPVQDRGVWHGISVIAVWPHSQASSAEVHIVCDLCSSRRLAERGQSSGDLRDQVRPLVLLSWQGPCRTRPNTVPTDDDRVMPDNTALLPCATSTSRPRFFLEWQGVDKLAGRCSLAGDYQSSCDREPRRRWAQSCSRVSWTAE